MKSDTHASARIFGLSQADALLTDAVLDLGRRHPSSHGMPRLRLTTTGVGDDEVVVHAEPLIGSMHRGAEKLFESRDYRQVLALTDRHDWLSAPGSEAGAAIAMESLLGIDVPRRAQWLRMLVCELNRIASHALFLAEFPWSAVVDAGDALAAWPVMRERLLAVRENLLDVICSVTGARMHVMWTVIGGVRNDVADDWMAAALASWSVTDVVSEVQEFLRRDAVTERLRGVGVLRPELVDAYAMSGIVARAAGVRRDVRVDAPYALYGEVADAMQVPMRAESDVLARLELLCEEMVQSQGLVHAIAAQLTQCVDAVNVQLPKVVRLPEGSVYIATENSLGANGFWLVSKGDKLPHRLKIRSASFNNLSAVHEVLANQPLRDVLPTLATWFFLSGDSDR